MEKKPTVEELNKAMEIRHNAHCLAEKCWRSLVGDDRNFAEEVEEIDTLIGTDFISKYNNLLEEHCEASKVEGRDMVSENPEYYGLPKNPTDKEVEEVIEKKQEEDINTFLPGGHASAFCEINEEIREKIREMQNEAIEKEEKGYKKILEEREEHRERMRGRERMREFLEELEEEEMEDEEFEYY